MHSRITLVGWWMLIVVSMCGAESGIAAWEVGTYGPVVIYPNQTQGCTVNFGMAFNACPAGYSYGALKEWYDTGPEIGVSGVFNMLTAASVSTVGAPCDFHISETDLPSGVLGSTRVDYVGTAILGAHSKINLTGSSGGVRTFDLTTPDGDRDLSCVIAHEAGHGIGLDHDGLGGVMTAPFSWGPDCRYLSEHDVDVGAHYTQSLRNACLTGDGPVVFGDIDATPRTSGGVLLQITTEYERDAEQLVILRAEGLGSPDADYEERMRMALSNFPQGHQYLYFDDLGEIGDSYMIDAIGSDGLVHSRAFVQANSGAPMHLEYPPGSVDAMRADSRRRMKFDRWREVFDGARGSESVASHSPICCDFLVIAHDEFARDLAPICDYWQFDGMQVRMLTCNAANTKEQIRQLIAEAHSCHPLRGVWLVGSVRRSAALDGVDLVPTDFDMYDFYYSDVDGDGVIDVPIGRLPARLVREVVFYVNKELRYHWEVTWGGRKNPEHYSKWGVLSVPDNRASGSSVNWGLAEATVEAAGSELYQALSIARGSGRVSYLRSVDLPEWQGGSTSIYMNAVGAALKVDLVDGRHVQCGVALHHSSSQMFGGVNGDTWQDEVCIPGGECQRPCETFWILPLCFALDPGVNGGLDSTWPIASNNPIVYELFVNRGLLIFGSYAPVSRSLMKDVVLGMAPGLIEPTEMSQRASSLGELWKTVHNGLREMQPVAQEGIDAFGIYGDPMLYVRGVYPRAADVAGLNSRPLAVSASPTPFNGRVRLRAGGIGAEQLTLSIFDVRGRRVLCRVVSTDSDGTATFDWDARDESGRPVSSGNYLIRVTTGDGRAAQCRTVLLK